MLTLKYGYPPGYVLDEMKMYEVRAVLDYGYLKDQESWEQTRLASYIMAQTHSSKKLKVKDIVKFPWENENGQRKSTPEVMSDRDLDRLKSKAQWMLDNGMI